MSKRIIVLGGSGFLGSALIGHLTAQGHDVSAVVRSGEAAEKIRARSPWTTMISEPDGRTYDLLFNLIVDYGRNRASLAGVSDVNLVYPLRLIEAASCRTVINVSTVLPPCYSHYAFTKRALEHALDYLSAAGSFGVVNLRLHNFYGPGSDASNIVSFLIDKMLANEVVEMGDGLNQRDFLYLDDLLKCLGIIADTADALASQSPLEVGSGRAISLRDLAGMIRDLTGSSAPLHFGVRPGNPHEPECLRADIQPLRRLGWRPDRDLHQGLIATIESRRS